MNFLKAVKLFSVLYIFLLGLALINGYIYISIFYKTFEDYFTNTLVRTHNEILTKVKDDFLETPSIEKGKNFLLGMGIIYKDGTQKFSPKYSKGFWDMGKKYIKKEIFLGKTRPIKAGKIYFQIISSSYQDKKFISIYDSSSIGYLYDKYKIIRILIIIITLTLISYLYIIFKRGEKFYYAMLKETKENPLIKISGEEPNIIVEVLKKTNEELKILLKKEKEKYNELEILSNTLSKNMPSGLLVLDPENKIIKANSYAFEHLEIGTPKENPNLDEILFVYPKILKFVKEAVGKKSAIIKHSIEEKEKIFDFTIVPLLKEEVFQGTLILFQELTDTKKLEEELKQKETLANLGTFAAGIAHEFKNSLSTIIGYAKLLKSNENVEENQKYIKSLLDESIHMNEVINSFLEFTKIQKIEREECFIFDIFNNIINLLKTSYPSINFVIKGKNFKINLDESLFSQGIKAILENACFEQKEGNIYINLFEEKDNFKIEIKDSGGGMDEETLKKIFIPFFSTKPSGTGLGLFLAHRVISLHGGKILVSSKKGMGSTFTVILNKDVLQNDTHF